jgi:hypothetical protein
VIFKVLDVFFKKEFDGAKVKKCLFGVCEKIKPFQNFGTALG